MDIWNIELFKQNKDNTWHVASSFIPSLSLITSKPAAPPA
uniref:Uncharacterized protein n=1 Tax=Arundo donax TaxID=35708 RepID=A0A0A9H6V9_ARUDO